MGHHLSHFDDEGASRMVDVSGKQVTARLARASGRVTMSAQTLQMIRDRKLSKGDVLEVARLAGIMASKKTGEWIPLCHPLSLDGVSIDFQFPDSASVVIHSCVRVNARTGVEMEALTAVTAAALTIYDMCKGVDRTMVIDQVRLDEKRGGQSGHFLRSQPKPSPDDPESDH